MLITLFSLFARKLALVPVLESNLYDAIKAGDLKTVIDIIIETPCLVNSQNRKEDNPLNLAVEYGHYAITQWLLNHGAKVNARMGMNATTALYKIADDGLDIEIAKLLIQYGAYVNSQGNDGEHPLWVAIFHHNTDMVRLLVQNGANPNLRDDWRGSNTPLHLAAELGNVDKVAILVDAGADINARTGCHRPNNNIAPTPLSHVKMLGGVRHGNPYAGEWISFSEKIGCSSHATPTEKRCHYNHTPLHLAALRGHAKVVKYLLEQREIDAMATDNGGYTALELAKEQLKMINALQARARNPALFLHNPEAVIKVNFELASDERVYKQIVELFTPDIINTKKAQPYRGCILQ